MKNKSIQTKTLKIISASLNSDKALDIKIINVMKKTSFTDYIIITSGTSKRHIITMAKNLKEKLKKNLNFTPSLEGTEKGEWVLIDANFTVINIFKPEIRNFYNLEKLWEN